jgi:predicted Zn-dependent protease with MMP-like domain
MARSGSQKRRGPATKRESSQTFVGRGAIREAAQGAPPLAQPVPEGPRPPVSARLRWRTFTTRERCALFAIAGWLVSGHIFFFAVFAAEGRLALVSAAVFTAFFFAYVHFADVSPAPDLGASSGMTGEQLDRLIDEVDRLQGLLPDRPHCLPPASASTQDDNFARLVRDALDELPDFMQRELPNVAVMVSDRGRTFRPSGQALYGCYHGGTVRNRSRASHIYIFKDTLTADFGHDPHELRKQVARTVRHELAHHLGERSEHRIRQLGL